MATKRRPPPDQPYYTPGQVTSRTAWNAPSDPNAAYPQPITPTDEPEPGDSSPAPPEAPGDPSLPSTPSQPALTETPPPQQLNPPPDQGALGGALGGRTWDSINQGLQGTSGQTQEAQQTLAAQPQGTSRTWDSVNQTVQGGGTQGAQGGQDQPPQTQPPPEQQPSPVETTDPDAQFKDKVAAATNVESKGGPPASELTASTQKAGYVSKPPPGGLSGQGYDANTWDAYLDQVNQEHNLPPNLLRAIARQEGVDSARLNPLGISKSKLGTDNFSNMDDAKAAIEALATKLTDPKGDYADFVKSGKISDLAKVYSPVGENDPNKTNVTEPSGIEQELAKLNKGDGGGQQQQPQQPAQQTQQPQPNPYGFAPDMIDRFNQFKQAVKDQLGLDVVVTEGYRSPQRSDQLHATGIKAVPGGFSYHNYGEAFDYGFRLPNGKTDLFNEKAYTAAEQIAHQFGLTGISGDSGHIQNASYTTSADLRKAYPNGYTPSTTVEPKTYSGAYIPSATVSGSVSTGKGQGGPESTQEDKSGAVVPVPAADEEKPEEEKPEEASTWKPEEAQALPESAQQKALPQGEGRIEQEPEEQDLEENITSPMLNPPGGLMSPQQAAIQGSAKAKKKPEDEEDQGEEEGQGGQQPDAVSQALAQYQSAPTQTAKNAALQTLKQAHLDSLSDTDTRVQHDPVTNKFKGTHFMGNDLVHQDALSSMPADQKAKLAVGQEAIQGNQLMHASYGSAPASSAVIPSAASREQEYAQDPAGQRSLANAQIAGHSFMPVDIGVTHSKKKGEGNKGYIEGMSASIIAHNANHFNDALGADSPYPDITDPKFGDDFEGYVSNLNNGWTGNGQSRVKGTNAVPIQANEDYEPHLLTDQEANFMNAILHNIAGKNKGGESKQRALDLAAANGRQVGPDGETNPFRAMVDNRQMRRAWYPGQAEPPSRPWSDEMLSSAFKTFHANLIHQLHDHPGQMAEGIRPPEGVDRIAAALQRRGVPHKDLVAANVVGGPVGEAEGKPRRPGGPGQMQLPLEGESQNKQIYWVKVDELEQHLKKKGRKKT